MQDLGPVQFEICGNPHPHDLLTRLVVMYLFFSICGLITVVIKYWTILGFQASTLSRKLIRLDQLQSQRDWLELRTLALKFHCDSPAAGLRSFNDSSEVPSSLSLLTEADLHFKTKADRFDWSLKNLSRWREATLLILAAYATTELANMLSKIATEKSAGVGALSGGFSEVLLVLSFGYWFLIALFFCRWHFTARIRKYTEIWTEFITHAKTNLSIGGNHEQ